MEREEARAAITLAETAEAAEATPACGPPGHHQLATGSSARANRERELVTVRIRFRNKLTGETMGAAMQTNDYDCIAVQDAVRESWLRRRARQYVRSICSLISGSLRSLLCRVSKARDAGWPVEHTSASYDEGELEAGRLSVSGDPQLAATMQRRDQGLSTIHFDYYNTRTMQQGSASTSTNDPDAVSLDPIKRERWRKRLARNLVRN